MAPFNSGGYSLLEVIVTLSICSLVGAAALAGLGGSRSASTKAAAEEIMRRLNQAAILAAASHREFCAVASSPDSIKFEECSGTNTHPPFLLPKSVRIEQFVFGGPDSAKLVLRPNGTASPGRIELSGNDLERCVLRQALRGARELSCSRVQS